MLIFLIVFGPFILAGASYMIGKKNENCRDLFVTVGTAAELLLSLLLFSVMPSYRIAAFMTEAGLSFTTDGFRAVYAVITAFMWAGTTLFAKEYFSKERENLNRYWFFTLLTLGATEGVMLSGDLMTAFLFFEILSFTSFTWVIHEESPEAVRAGYTYLFIAVIGGLVLFMGLALLRYAAGTLSFEALGEAVRVSADQQLILPAGICILFGFGCKAGMFPVHVWLPKAHPVAPSPASALLSGILTKVGVYGILMISCTALMGNEIFALTVLLPGVITMALGAVLALFSVNLKRTLACSSMSQIGFILTGTGMMLIHSSGGNREGTGIALAGLTLHMVNHSLIKLTLFMAAGVVMMNLRVLTLDEIRGYGRNKPLLMTGFALGALGISGVPLFNGYLSKTLLHEGIVEGIRNTERYGGLLSVIEWIFLFSGGLTFAYMLKLFICIFVQRNRDERVQQSYDRDRKCMNMSSGAAVFGSSLLMIVLGQPFISTRLINHMTGFEEILDFRAFTAENLKGAFISLAIGAFVYLTVVRRVLVRNGSYVDLWPEKLDLEDLIYRPLITRYLPSFMGKAANVFGENRILKPLFRICLKAAIVVTRIFEGLTDGCILLLRRTVMRERKVKCGEETEPGFLIRLSTVLAAGAGQLFSNFSFAMMMTCIGIIIVLCYIQIFF